MSRWLPDHLHITLAPDHIVLARAALRLKFSGPSLRWLSRAHLPITAGGPDQPAWSAALPALENALGELTLAIPEVRRCRATVIISNHFVRYALVPWSNLINDAAEELALTSHYFHETYGDAAEHWELRVSPDHSGALQLASALQPELLNAVRELFVRTGIRLVSVQPHLMNVCNTHRQRLGSGEAWLAVVEPGSLCLALLQSGRLVRLRSQRLGSDWPNQLITALERENFLSDREILTRDLFLAAAGMESQEFPDGLPWSIQRLAPAETADKRQNPASAESE